MEIIQEMFNKDLEDITELNSKTIKMKSTLQRIINSRINEAENIKVSWKTEW